MHTTAFDESSATQAAAVPTYPLTSLAELVARCCSGELKSNHLNTRYCIQRLLRERDRNLGKGRMTVRQRMLMRTLSVNFSLGLEIQVASVSRFWGVLP